MDYLEILTEVYNITNSQDDSGKVITYIPELAKVNPNRFGVYLTTIDNQGVGVGDWNIKFSIQSVAKALALTLAYQKEGGKIWTRLHAEPSGTPFNSLVQLETDSGIPRNPFVNAGALVICDILISILDHPMDDFLAFVRDVSGIEDLDYSKNIAASERSVGYRNIALCYFIKSFGNIHNDPEKVLNFYFNLCSLEMTCEQLSRTFLYLAHDGKKTTDKKQILNYSRTKRINAIMQTCGFYDEAGEYTFRVGLPGKSGVGGGIIAIHPHKYTIAVWSPRLNAKGNSFKGMKFLERFTTKTASSIF